MLLPVSSPPTPVEGKQIAVSSSNLNEIMYVVPAGKTFVGIATGKVGASSLLINGATLHVNVNSTGSSSTPVPLTLLSGTVVKNAASAEISLIGVEQ